MTFRPTLSATVAALVALTVLLGLGTWQLDRRQWKREIIDTRSARVSAPRVSFFGSGVLPPMTLKELEFRPISVRGRYRTDAAFKLFSRTRNGRAGFHVVTPLDTVPGSATVLVDRGWVPVGRDSEVEKPPTGIVTVEGFARRFETPGRFTPDNSPAEGIWYYLDLPQLASEFNKPSLAPFYVQLGPDITGNTAYPIGNVPAVTLRNPHLQYALTWYALAIALAVIYVVFHVRRRAGEDD